MSFLAKHPERYLDQAVDGGQCVAFVRKVAGAPHTSYWRPGVPVAMTDIATGTAIATFDRSGRYGNHTDGRSHAAIYVQTHGAGIRVWDQWKGQPVHQRVIRWKDGVPPACDDASQFYVIETEEVPDD
jgi:hypothetical protein